jgi:hypothetical protein
MWNASIPERRADVAFRKLIDTAIPMQKAFGRYYKFTAGDQIL